MSEETSESMLDIEELARLFSIAADEAERAIWQVVTESPNLDDMVRSLVRVVGFAYIMNALQSDSTLTALGTAIDPKLRELLTEENFKKMFTNPDMSDDVPPNEEMH
jgi:hypothetical protein